MIEKAPSTGRNLERDEFLRYAKALRNSGFDHTIARDMLRETGLGDLVHRSPNGHEVYFEIPQGNESLSLIRKFISEDPVENGLESVWTFLQSAAIGMGPEPSFVLFTTILNTQDRSMIPLKVFTEEFLTGLYEPASWEVLNKSTDEVSKQRLKNIMKRFSYLPRPSQKRKR